MKGLYYVLDDDGQPLAVDDVRAWAQWFTDYQDRRIVAQDDVGGFRVSTVFLGLDHDHSGRPNALPVLWETMIFAGEDWSDLACWRYTSHAAALAGHAEAVRRLRAGEVSI